MPGPAIIEGFKQNAAILIAIDEYTNGIPELQTPVADAEKLEQVLRDAHGFRTHLVKNTDATSAKLKGLLSCLETKIEKDDRVLFYFAGHGTALQSDDGPRGFLLPQDADRSSDGNYLAMEDLNKALSALKCRHMLVILDCCFAGALRWGATRDLVLPITSLHRQRYEWFIQDAAWQAIASAAHDQKALDVAAARPLGYRDDTDSKDHSPFASALIRGLEGAADMAAQGGVPDGVITATELYSFLQGELLPKRAGDFRQTPIFWPMPKHDKGEFVFLAPGKPLSLPEAPLLDEDANPWRGLEPYEAKHADLFRGRDAVTKNLIARVFNERLVAVTGPSGVGKSSIVRAGLLPALRDRPLDVITVRPGPLPFASLARAFLDTLPEEAGLPDASQLAKASDALAAWLKGRSGERETLLVIDQAEELITMSRDDQVATKFLDLIDCALQAGGHRLRVVFTVRSEFEPQFAQSPLKACWAAARFLVPPMTQDELRRVIEEPAAVKVMRFEPSELVDRLVNEVVQMPGALPLLSFALSQMYGNYLKRHSDDRALTDEDYNALGGGVPGALRARADQIIKTVDEGTARRVLERMVSVDSGEYARRRVPKLEFAVGDAAEQRRVDHVIKQLEDARLVVTDSVAGQPSLELAHDALIFGWARLLSWVREDSQRIAALRRLTGDEREWELADRKKNDLLWSDAARSVVAQELLSADYPGLNGGEQDFAKASLDRSKKNSRIRTLTFASLSALALIAAAVAGLYGIGVWQSKVDQLLAAARSAHSAGDAARAYAFSLAALEKTGGWLPSGQRKTMAQSLINSDINAGVPMVYPQLEATFSVTLSEKGNLVAVVGRTKGDAAAQKNTLMIGPPNNLEAKVIKGMFTAGTFRPGHNEYYVASRSDKFFTIERFDPSTANQTGHFVIPGMKLADGRYKNLLNPTMVDEMRFSADGKTLLIAGWTSPDENGILASPWRAYLNVESGEVDQYASPDQQVDLPYAVKSQHVAYSPDGFRAASIGIANVYLDDLSHPGRVVVGSHGQGAPLDVAISPSGKQILSGGDAGSATLFRQSSDGTWKGYNLSLPGNEDVELVRFVSEDQIAVSRSDSSINVSWIKSQAPRPEPRGRPIRDAAAIPVDAAQPPIFADTRTLRGHTGKIQSLIVDTKHKRLLSAGEDRDIRIWGLESGERRILRGSERAVEGLTLSGSADWLLSWGVGGKILAWRLPEGISLAYTNTFPDKKFEDSVQTDSYLGAGDGSSLMAYVHRLDSHFIEGLKVADNGRRVLAGYYGGPVVAWDRDTSNVQTLGVSEGIINISKDGEYLTVSNADAHGNSKVFKRSEGYSRAYTTAGEAILNNGQWVTIERGTPVFRSLTELSAQDAPKIDNYLSEGEVRRFSEDGEWLVSLQKKRYCLWKKPFKSAGSCGRTPAPWSFVRSDPVFSGNQMLAMAAGADGNRLVQVDLVSEAVSVFETGELASIFVLSNNGSYIAAAGRFGELYLGNASDFRLREIGRHARQIQSLAFSDDGNWIATGGLDRMVKVWSTSTLDSAQYEFLNPIERIEFDRRFARWLVTSGSSVFAVPLFESGQVQTALERVSNVRVDQKNLSSTRIDAIGVVAFP